MEFIPAEIIKKKRRGLPNHQEEIEFFVNSFTNGTLPAAQMSAWLMAICFQGMNSEETAILTQTMKNSGKVMNFSHLSQRVDKHSTGGVGDKTSLILAPIAAAAGVHVPMIAGRGLGHTGGTLDKLESISGFHCDLSEEQFHDYVEKFGLALIGQTKDICPADKLIYSLRDVTGTVDSLPLICGSIMSKKLAEDLTGLVLDIKVGSGAFMKTDGEAEALARLLKETGELNNVKVSALITNMDQPLGRFVGNSVEVHECIEIMKGKEFIENGYDFYSDTRDLSLILAGYMIWLAGLAKSAEHGLDIANDILASGLALKYFEELCARQGAKNIYDYKLPKHKYAVIAEKSGVISAINAEKIGLAALSLGAGRKTSSDTIDYSAGIEFNCKVGFKVKKGDVLAFICGDNPEKFEDPAQKTLDAITISEAGTVVVPRPLISNVID